MYRLNGAKKTFAISLLAAITMSSIALPSAWTQFQKTYNISAGSTLGKAKCAVCHTTMKSKALNAYGKAIDAVLKKEGTKAVTAAVLHKVESQDSSGSGKSNLQRIHADELPGG